MINHIITYTGKVFDLLEPQPEQVCIEDIAHSLAYQCRYAGHTRFFYSVAQHCILMATNSSLPGNPMVKLLHDADEAYIGDIASPWKNLLWVQMGHGVGITMYGVREFEQDIQDVIGIALGVDLTHSAEIKTADIRMMATEIRDLMPPGFNSEEWGLDISDTIKEIIEPWSPEKAEARFLLVYDQLSERIGV